MTTYIYPSLSNRVATRRDSTVGTAGHSDQSFSSDASGSRLLHVKGVGTGVDSTYWQYDALSRLVGTMRSIPGSPSRTRLEHYNECRWDAAWRLAQPCGASGQLSFVGSNVSHSSLGWFFVQAPGIDETVVMVDRNGSGFVNKRLQSVTDGRGQLLAVGDSSGDLTAPYAGSGYDQAAWQGGGLTSRAQTFDPRKWETSMDWACPAPRRGGGGGIQQFRNRAYDPGTGTWIQEDPIGVAGGVNLYQYSNANPASFSDPFGMCPNPPCRSEDDPLRDRALPDGVSDNDVTWDSERRLYTHDKNGQIFRPHRKDVGHWDHWDVTDPGGRMSRYPERSLKPHPGQKRGLRRGSLGQILGGHRPCRAFVRVLGTFSRS